MSMPLPLPCRRPAAKRQATRWAHRALTAALFMGLSMALAIPAIAQDDFLYALNEKGTLTANATVLDKLPGKVTSDPDTFGEVWWKLLIDGSDRFALRLDGRIQKNGAVFDNLDFSSVFEGSWVDFTMADGELWALRNDGALARDGTLVVMLPLGEFFFQGLVARGTDVFSLRSDGSVYKNLDLTPVLQWDGGPGVISGAAEGEDVDTVWRRIALDPIDNEIYSIRNDGKVARGDPDAEGDPPSGVLVAALPFNTQLNTQSQAAVFAELYSAIAFLDDGTFRTLNGRGEIFEEGSYVEPVVNLPGGPLSSSVQLYVDILGGEDFTTLRSDGSLFVGIDEDVVVKLAGKAYRSLASSDSPPDLTQFKNTRPVVTSTKAVALEGQAISIPVLASDVEKTEEDLTFTPDMDTIPAGATWNDSTNTLDWPNPGPKGKYTFKVSVDDGVTKPVISKNTVAVKPMDANTVKNRKPVAAKVKKAQALINVPFNLPIVATDLDGDVLSMSVNMDKAPFTEGATFDTNTNTFSWTPSLKDIGKHKVVILISDGVVTRKRGIKLKVVASLLGL